jgi:hypothetical protein
MRGHFSTRNGAAEIADFPERLISLRRSGKHPRVTKLPSRNARMKR